jgi:hypothetical protein
MAVKEENENCCGRNKQTRPNLYEDEKMDMGMVW